MEDVDKIAEHLASAISNCQILDMEDLKAKIRAALIIAAPPETKNVKGLKLLESKLGEKNTKSKFLNKRMSEEIKFWKSKCKYLLDDWAIQQYYKELDEILESHGYKVKG